MASVSSILPTLFRWAFTVLVVLTALAVVMMSILLLINPHLPADIHFGPHDIDFLGQPGSIAIFPANGDTSFLASLFRGDITLSISRAGGLFEVVKHYGLPLVLLRLIFFTALFELLRRLFRNVERRESFTPDTIRLVQIVGGLLIVFSFVFVLVDNLFASEAFAYFASHAVLTISGTAVHLPVPHPFWVPRLRGFFRSSMLYYGLLVLALSEVFRQGLALQKDAELTI
jgi:hypothetical protein